jgi:hypothetical protein
VCRRLEKLVCHRLPNTILSWSFFLAGGWMRGRKDDGRRRLIRAQPQQEEEEEERGRRWVEEGLGAALGGGGAWGTAGLEEELQPWEPRSSYQGAQPSRNPLSLPLPSRYGLIMKYLLCCSLICRFTGF